MKSKKFKVAEENISETVFETGAPKKKLFRNSSAAHDIHLREMI
jgi:hypothetical protein